MDPTTQKSTGPASAPGVVRVHSGTPWNWVPWVGGIALAGIAGAALGVTGMLPPAATSASSPYHVVQVTTPGFECPGGPAVTTLGANERVLAMARDESAAWVQVRDPRDLAAAIWLPISVITLDDGDADVAGLPVRDGCPVDDVGYSLEPLPPEAPDSPPGQAPQTPPAPQPPPAPSDTTKPIVTKGEVAGSGCPYQFRVTASDNVGVTSVRISWTGLDSGNNVAMFFSGGIWRYDYLAPNVPPHVSDYSFTVVARDAAGNDSVPYHFSQPAMGCFG